MYHSRSWITCGGMTRIGLRLLQALLPALVIAGLVVAPAQAADAGTACAPMPPFGSPHDRFGVNVVRDHGKTVANYDVAQTRAGWYLDYSTAGTVPSGVSYVRVLRVENLKSNNWRNSVAQAVHANPGAIWVIGNEPDREGQDGVTAGDYATIYHDTYTLIKQTDPLATVANGAIVQATPVRFIYWDTFLSAYRAKYGKNPTVDYWNIHNFILREEIYPPDNWGASIPPDLEAYNDKGMKYKVWEHGDIGIFKEQIIAFRTWMAVNGYRDVPLTVSEYGILMPYTYAAAAPPSKKTYDYDFVRKFMLASFDFFMNATDPAIGQPQDGNRLVQSWGWFSLNDYMIDPSLPYEEWRGSNGNLIEHDSGVITALGKDFAAYIAGRDGYGSYRDPAVRQIKLSRGQIGDNAKPGTIQIEVAVQNRGNLPANNGKVQVWWERGPGDRVLVGESVMPTVTDRCRQMHVAKFTWQPSWLPVGRVTLVAEISTGAGETDAILTNNSASVSLKVNRGDKPKVYLPSVFD